MPIRVGKYHPSATPDERRKLLQAVMQIASDAAAIIPESMLIEFLEAKGGGGGGSIPFERIGRYLDEQLSKAILGQTMTSDNGSSEAQAKIHNQIRIDILEDDADQLGVTINRDLIAPFVAWNFGANAKAPIVVFPVAEPEDVQVMAEALKKLVPLGLKVAMSEVREKIGFSEPEEEDELLAAPAPAPIGHNGGPLDEEEEEPPPKHKSALNAFGLRGCPCCGTTERRSFALNAQDEAGAIGAEEDADWEPQLEPIVTAVIKAAEETSSYEEFAAQLAKLAGNIDAELLVRRIAIAQMKARGAGDGGDVRR
jgi:phage gp29-like protein